MWRLSLELTLCAPIVSRGRARRGTQRSFLPLFKRHPTWDAGLSRAAGWRFSRRLQVGANLPRGLLVDVDLSQRGLRVDVDMLRRLRVGVILQQLLVDTPNGMSRIEQCFMTACITSRLDASNQESVPNRVSKRGQMLLFPALVTVFLAESFKNP